MQSSAYRISSWISGSSRRAQYSPSAPRGRRSGSRMASPAWKTLSLRYRGIAEVSALRHRPSSDAVSSLSLSSFLRSAGWLHLPIGHRTSSGVRRTPPTTRMARCCGTNSTAYGSLTTSGIGESHQARFGEPTLITPRLGQGAFRVVITELYGRQCALTDGRVLPALDAAHIVPYAKGGSHAKTNGILLRKDIHSVFDAGYATLDTDYRFVVSQKVRDIFNNGSEYLRLHGAPLRLPANPLDRPDKSALRWHNDHRFEK